MLLSVHLMYLGKCLSHAAHFHRVGDFNFPVEKKWEELFSVHLPKEEVTSLICETGRRTKLE